MKFVSTPAGAKVVIDAGGRKPVEGITPCELRLRLTSRPVTLTFTSEGAELYEGEIVPAANGGAMAFAFIELALFFIPGVVDLGSGATYDWPHEVQATLPEKGTGPPRVKFIRSRPKEQTRTSFIDPKTGRPLRSYGDSF